MTMSLEDFNREVKRTAVITIPERNTIAVEGIAAAFQSIASSVASLAATEAAGLAHRKAEDARLQKMQDEQLALQAEAIERERTAARVNEAMAGSLDKMVKKIGPDEDWRPGE